MLLLFSVMHKKRAFFVCILLSCIIVVTPEASAICLSTRLVFNWTTVITVITQKCIALLIIIIIFDTGISIIIKIVVHWLIEALPMIIIAVVILILRIRFIPFISICILLVVVIVVVIVIIITITWIKFCRCIIRSMRILTLIIRFNVIVVRRASFISDIITNVAYLPCTYTLIFVLCGVLWCALTFVCCNIRCSRSRCHLCVMSIVFMLIYNTLILFFCCCHCAQSRIN